MTTKYNNVYLNEVGTVVGPYENAGPLGKFFDKNYDDLYFGCDTWEQAESKLISDSIDIVLNKASLTKYDIDVMISGDLLNQITASNYGAIDEPFSMIGVYAACASSMLGIALGSNMIESNQVDKVLCCASSHNNGAEKQFRYPVEYGGPKPKTTTFTATGAACALLSNQKSKIKVESSTIGKVIDSGISDVFNMGAVMAVAAADTIYTHLKDTGRSIGYYDMVFTGDLGVYGRKILKEYMFKEFGISLNNYDDTGTILYDLEKQPVYAGASGVVCAPLVTYTYVLNEMKKKNFKRVLVVATGALHSQSLASQGLTIPSIAHAVSLEVVK